MYIKKSHLAIFFVIIIMLAACGASSVAPTSAAASTKTDSDTICPTGVTEIPVKVSDPSGVISQLGGIRAFLTVPNEGCNMPTLFCQYAFAGYGGGLSCSPVSK